MSTCVLSEERIEELRAEYAQRPGWIGLQEAIIKAANEGAAKAREWQPIETAPTGERDQFIGLHKDGRAVTARPAYYVNYEKQPDGTHQAVGTYRSKWHEVERGALVPCTLLAWMPLPPER